MSKRRKVIERRLQFTTHDEVGLIGIYRPAFVQEVGASLGSIQENKPLSKHMKVDDFSYTQGVRRTERGAKGAHDSPYILDQSVALSHSWWAVRLKMLPMSGNCFGPGGLGDPEPDFLVR